MKFLIVPTLLNWEFTKLFALYSVVVVIPVIEIEGPAAAHGADITDKIPVLFQLPMHFFQVIQGKQDGRKILRYLRRIFEHFCLVKKSDGVGSAQGEDMGCAVPVKKSCRFPETQNTSSRISPLFQRLPGKC